jgi:DNA-binding transcriptional regulator YdaS (Cro superfamily)
MDKLIKYLNSLSRDEQIRFGLNCGTSIGYLRKAASTGQLISIATCVLIERESGGVVTRKDLRHDWLANWPELATTKKSKSVRITASVKV